MCQFLLETVVSMSLHLFLDISTSLAYIKACVSKFVKVIVDAHIIPLSIHSILCLLCCYILDIIWEDFNS